MTSQPERIVITGLGTVGAGGSNVAALWENTVAGRVNVATRFLPQMDRHLAVYAVRELPGVTPKELRLTRHADRAAVLALGAAREAWQSANLADHGVDPLRIGAFVGSSRGPAEINALTGGTAPKNRFHSVYTSFSSIAGVISAALRIQGCSMMTSATCISGAVALKSAMQMIQSGELDLALAGGVDAPLVESLLEQFATTQVLAADCSAEALRPFTSQRTGTVMGEGAAFLVLESESSALRRGVAIHGWLHHVALHCDSIRAGGDKEGVGLRQATQRALAAMAASPRDIDLLHLHGTGTDLNDAMESHCVESLFGPEADQPYSWASKAITGHPLGASAAFQVILTLEAMRHSLIPGTTNCVARDPACHIRLSMGAGVRQQIRTALCLTSGFWGNSSCIGLRSYAAREDSAAFPSSSEPWKSPSS